MKTVIVLQARMGSSRLPGKALSRIAGRPILAHCIERLQASGVAPVIVATTTAHEDDAIVAEAEARGATVFRGPRDHVLERVVLVARLYRADRVIRATADNPGVDCDAVRRVIAHADAIGADHVVEHGLPYGTAVEAVSAAALERAMAESRDAYDHEHVTPYIVRRPDRFRVARAVAPAAVRRPDLRLTVDTREDLIYMREVFAEASVPAAPGPVSLKELIRAADRIRRVSLDGAA